VIVAVSPAFKALALLLIERVGARVTKLAWLFKVATLRAS
jgi:hypothetical protein